MTSSSDYGLSYSAQTVRANTNPSARFHWPSGRIIVALRGDGAVGTDMYYTYKPCSSNCNGYGWENAIQVNDSSTNDQFMPGMDFASNGNIVIAFYDRREDPGNLLFHEYYAYINADGVALQANQRISTFASNPDAHTRDDGAVAQFMGDYQDVWDWTYATGERAVAAFGLIPPDTNGELYLSRISP